MTDAVHASIWLFKKWELIEFEIIDYCLITWLAYPLLMLPLFLLGSELADVWKFEKLSEGFIQKSTWAIAIGSLLIVGVSPYAGLLPALPGLIVAFPAGMYYQCLSRRKEQSLYPLVVVIFLTPFLMAY